MQVNPDFAQSLLTMLEAAYAKGDGDTVETGRGKGQLLGIALLGGNAVREPLLLYLLPHDGKHLVGKVEPQHIAVGVCTAGNSDAVVTRATGKVENLLWLLPVDHPAQRATAPEAVDAQREEMVEAVVGGCDSAEHVFGLLCGGCVHIS